MKKDIFELLSDIEIKDVLAALNIDRATVEKVARELSTNPALKDAFEKQLRGVDSSFEDTVDNVYEHIEKNL